MTLKVKMLLLLLLCCNTLIRSQTVTANMITALPGDNFTYDGEITPHYGIYWTGDSWRPGAYTAWISSYGGIKFFTSEERKFSIQDIIEASTPFVINPANAEKNYIKFKNNGTDIGIVGSNGSIYGNSATDFGIYVYGYNNLDFSTNGTRRMTITGSGNIGIGTPSPDEKLSVNGKIRAKEVKVEATGWPDYVFAPSYKLMPLQEVEKFVQVNNHLPGVPPAKQVEKEGLELASNQMMLLKKIEELTLYIIEQEKVNDQQAAEIRALQRQLKKTILKN